MDYVDAQNTDYLTSAINLGSNLERLIELYVTPMYHPNSNFYTMLKYRTIRKLGLEKSIVINNDRFLIEAIEYTQRSIITLLDILNKRKHLLLDKSWSNETREVLF
jgi:hypothetical protein